MRPKLLAIKVTDRHLVPVILRASHIRLLTAERGWEDRPHAP